MADSHHPAKVRCRAFVSSVVEGYQAYRRAAGAGVIQAGATPVMLNEDQPALDSSPRNACLDMVDSSDLFLVVVGGRGGSTTPSGLTVVEEECERARRRKLPILCFTDRDPLAQRLVARLTDYVEGRYRISFSDPTELQQLVEESVHPYTQRESEMAIHDLSEHLDAARPSGMTTAARLVVHPERKEEVFSPVEIESPDFLRRLYDIGHSARVGLLTFEAAKRHYIRDRLLVVVQRLNHATTAQVSIGESGVVIVEAEVANGLGEHDPTGTHGVTIVAAERVITVLGAGMAFAGALFGESDPYLRHDRFYYNAALCGLGYRVLERAPRVRDSYPTRMGADDRAIIAFGSPRLVTRGDLLAPDAELERVIVELLRRGKA